ncbi:MAG TPA: universal stress protein [Ktedonobacterales bacterium]|nr:universal stress protein [Ktedonobacterales bacterium]
MMLITEESVIGSPAACIEDCVQRNNAGLAVMAAHMRGKLGHWLLGSVAQQVLRDTETPSCWCAFTRQHLNRTGELVTHL